MLCVSYQLVPISFVAWSISLTSQWWHVCNTELLQKSASCATVAQLPTISSITWQKDKNTNQKNALYSRSVEQIELVVFKILMTRCVHWTCGADRMVRYVFVPIIRKSVTTFICARQTIKPADASQNLFTFFMWPPLRMQLFQCPSPPNCLDVCTRHVGQLGSFAYFNIHQWE